jgi:AraC-like DNA-binding protein
MSAGHNLDIPLSTWNDVRHESRRSPDDRVAGVGAVADLRPRHAVRAIRHSHGALPIALVARDLGLSERTLERLFREQVGVRPKVYARIARMEWAREIAGSHRASQAALATLAGYADEPHLLRDFRALTGLTPGALLAETRVGFVQVEDAVSA